MKTLNKLTFITATLFGSLAFRVQAAPKSWKIVESNVNFQAVGKPGFIRINGKDAKVNGRTSWDNGKLKGEYTVHLSELNSGLSLRDDHMKNKYLEVKKYPDAVLTIDPLEWNASSEGSPNFKGKLKLHGQEQDVQGQAKLKPDGKRLDVEASFQIILSHYKIDIPVYAGITVAEKVDIKVMFQAEEDSAAAK